MSKTTKPQTSSADVASCPCGSGVTYATCCAVHHRGVPAPTAQALMRSRYSAYALGLSDYVLETWHADTRPPELTLDAGTRWLGLKVLDHAVLADERAEVEFVARYRVGGASAVRLHERSRFQRVDGRWYYVDGNFPQA